MQDKLAFTIKAHCQINIICFFNRLCCCSSLSSSSSLSHHSNHCQAHQTAAHPSMHIISICFYHHSVHSHVSKHVFVKNIILFVALSSFFPSIHVCICSSQSCIYSIMSSTVSVISHVMTHFRGCHCRVNSIVSI